jgi:hypothetical protein
MNILDEYVKSIPTDQNIIDLFKGEWSSKLPATEAGDLISGHAELFNDHRIFLLNDYFNLTGKRILELGPLEAGHTYMMHQMGAESILAVEANSRAYLKCLAVKEVFKLTEAHFILGDVMEYMKNDHSTFDLMVASGILYHATSPPQFIEECCKKSDRVFVWSHYYNPETIGNYPAMIGKFSKLHQLEYKSNIVKAWQFDYLSSLEWAGFCGGPNPYSLWVEKDSIFKLFQDNGLKNIKVFFDDHTHPSGPNICFMAEK